MREKLNILNGQAMYDYYVEHNLNLNGNYIPFNEAMCEGIVSEVIFSDEFIKSRCDSHQVSLLDYQRITLEPLHLFLTQNYSNLFLWFDEDMFCQINLLTLLGFLDQINYDQKVTLILVTKEFKLIDSFEVDVQGFHELYKQVLIDHEIKLEVKLIPLKKAIELYIEYLKPDNEITRFIEEKKELPNEVLLNELMTTFSHYGLGDQQYQKLIESNRRNRE